MSRALKLLGWLVTALLLCGIIYIAGSLFLFPGSSQPDSNGVPTPSYLVPLLNAKVAGNNRETLTQYQAIQNDSQSTSEQKALAEISATGAEFNLTGNTAALLRDVQNLKKIVLDPTVSTATRAVAMNVLGSEYGNSGQNPAVFAAVFSGAPFNSYLVPGNPQLSNMNIQKASYAMYPISSSAMSVALIASQLAYFTPKQSTTTAAYVATAEQYYKEANAMMIKEAQINESFLLSDRYLFDRAWAAIVVGNLALVVGQPYEGIYRQQFNDFFTFIQPMQSSLAQNFKLSERYAYALILAADKDRENEKIQLDQLAQDLKALRDPYKNPFVMSLLHTDSTGALSKATQAMMKVSPDFKAEVTKLIASSGK